MNKFYRIIAVPLLFTSFLLSLRAQTKGDLLFADTMHTIEINSETEPDLYENLMQEVYSTPGTYPHHLVDVIIDGNKLDSVTVRVKGLISTLGDIPPLKIDFDEYVEDQTCDGLNKLNLNNSYLDDSKQKDRLIYKLYKDVGIPSPRTSYAEIYINEEFIGVYLVVEQINKIFLKENFATNDGSLWKASFNQFGADPALDYFNPQMIASTVDMRNFCKFNILAYIVGAIDNFPVTDNNYYTYYNDKSMSYYFLPWDHHLSFSDNEDSFLGIFPNESFFFNTDFWAIPEIRDTYLEVACELMNYLFDADQLTDFIEDTIAIIESNTQGINVDNPISLINFMENKKQNIINELQSTGFDCSTLDYPFQPNDLVINEFVAKSDSVGGVQEPNGGTPDWIELYNNSDQDIVLNHHFYLSDDIDFPKKWNFKTPVTIPSHGYQIIWADRDIHQDGVHANFKIEKSGGDLMLVYEDLTIIDKVSYSEQELNKGYARIPNGTGSFVIQDYTFNANNEIASSIETNHVDNIIHFYPNPAQEILNIITSETLENVHILSSDGRFMLEQNNNLHKVDILQLPDGIYFLQIQTDRQSHILKFVKR